MALQLVLLLIKPISLVLTFPLYSSLSDSNAPDHPTQPLSNPIPPIIISARKVRRVLRLLKTDKASGPDGIPPRFLKEFAEELAPVLCRLFCLVLISCTYTSFWKHALVQPVPKKGDHSNPSNYCPIALTSAVAKVFETLLTPTSSNILNLTIFFPITSMASVKQGLQGIFFPILLMPGHPLLGTSENHLSSLLIFLRHLTESGIRPC